MAGFAVTTEESIRCRRRYRNKCLGAKVVVPCVQCPCSSKGMPDDRVNLAESLADFTDDVANFDGIGCRPDCLSVRRRIEQRNCKPLPHQVFRDWDHGSEVAMETMNQYNSRSVSLLIIFVAIAVSHHDFCAAPLEKCFGAFSMGILQDSPILLHDLSQFIVIHSLTVGVPTNNVPHPGRPNCSNEDV